MESPTGAGAAAVRIPAGRRGSWMGTSRHALPRLGRQFQLDHGVLNALAAAGWVFLETSGNHGFHGRQDRRFRHQSRHRLFQNGVVQFRALTRKCPPPAGHFVEQRAISEHVAAPVRRLAPHLLRRAIGRGALVVSRQRRQNPHTRTGNSDGERRQPAVDQAARVRPVERGANLQGVTQRLFGRQRTLRESLGQELAADGLVAGKTHFALAHFDHDLSTPRHLPRAGPFAAVNQILLSAVPNHNETAQNEVPAVLPDDGAPLVLSRPLRDGCNGIFPEREWRLCASTLLTLPVAHVQSKVAPISYPITEAA